MAQTIKDKIKVSELSKYGVKVGDEYVNFSKGLSEAARGKLVPGGEYEVELYVADSGKRYINSVESVKLPVMKADVPKKEAAKETVKPAVAKAKEDSMSKDEWAAKDRRISRQGCIQIAVQVTANFDDAVVLANKMLEFVNQ